MDCYQWEENNKKGVTKIEKHVLLEPLQRKANTNHVTLKVIQPSNAHYNDHMTSLRRMHDFVQTSWSEYSKASLERQNYLYLSHY